MNTVNYIQTVFVCKRVCVCVCVCFVLYPDLLISTVDVMEMQLQFSTSDAVLVLNPHTEITSLQPYKLVLPYCKSPVE